MRFRKFKFWHKEKQKWIEPLAWDYIFDPCNGRVYKNGWDCTESFEIVQFTGFVDQYKVEIYEGSVLQYDNERYEVVWSDEWGMFTVSGCQVQALMRYAEYGYVLGHVYEKPELVRP